MKVWELIAGLSKCPAGADVNVGINVTLDVGATDFEFEDGQVFIRSSQDVECCKDNGDTEWLSSLVADED